jgi:hypothetical protein
MIVEQPGHLLKSLLLALLVLVVVAVIYAASG